MITPVKDNKIDLSDAAIAKMDKQTLINSVIASFELDDFEKIRVQSLMLIRASELNITTAINRMISAYQKREAAKEGKHSKALTVPTTSIALKNDRGVPAVTIDNFLLVMRNDPRYEGVRFNLLANSPEIHTDGDIRRWTDADEAESRHYIESTYNIHSENKHYDALRILWRERAYHPIQDLVESIRWDGTARVEQFLTKWMSAEDTPYVREVSRLIFAGGIARLYLPGCKFDDVPVLIGTSQGEGKSTIARWLAINDQFYSEVTEIDGQRGVEQLEGTWICEIAELLALTKAKEQEAVKSYITRQCDKYRKPWDKNISEIPRRCIFIGTTNSEQFLKDKSGNRRFYPVKVNSSGYWLYDHEQECRDYIAQCWAEAKHRYDLNEMPPFANRALLKDFSEAQTEAMEDDWRVGAIEDYLDKLRVGERVCVRQIKHEALSVNRDFPQDPSPKESQEISVIMNKFPDWKKAGRQYISGFGQQRCWEKTGNNETIEVLSEPLPF